MIQISLQICLYSLIAVFAVSCNPKKKESKTENYKPDKESIEVEKTLVDYKEHDKVKAGLLDKSGNLWFGTSNEGVFRYDGEVFVQFTEQGGLSNNYVNCILEDQGGNIWFGTNNGLSKFDGKSFTEVLVPWKNEKDQSEDWWNKHIVQCMILDKNGHIWLGTGGHGVYRYDGNTFSHFSFTNDMPQSDGLHHNYIQSMVEDSEGNIWLTSMTHGYVTKYDGEKFTHFSSKDGLLDDMVFSSFQDKSGRLWFGTIQTKHKGLYYYDGEKFEGFGKEDGLCDNFVTGFYETQGGKLLIRTGSVLCVYDGHNFASFKTADGHKLEKISFITEGVGNHIWMGGNYGRLWRYDGQTLKDFTQKGR